MGKCNPARCNRDVAGWWATYQRKRQKATAATHLAGILDRRSQLGLSGMCLVTDIWIHSSDLSVQERSHSGDLQARNRTRASSSNLNLEGAVWVRPPRQFVRSSRSTIASWCCKLTCWSSRNLRIARAGTSPL